MKIGPIDIGIPTLAYVSSVMVLVLVAFQLYISKVAQRAVGRVEKRVRLCLIEGTETSFKEGAELCEKILVEVPDSPGARLYLATFLHSQGKFEQAGKVYAETASKSAASPEEAAMGSVGAAACAFALRSEREKTLGAADAEKILRKALESDKENPDALAALAVTTLWKGGAKAPAEAVALLRQVLSGRRPVGRLGSARLYNALGVALSMTDQASAAEETFQIATAIDPTWRQPRDNRALTIITSLSLPGMKLEERERLIEKYKDQIKVFAPHETKALNALAMGLWWTKQERKAAVYQNKSYPMAVALLSLAIDSNPSDVAAYWNLVGLFEDRLYGSAGANGRDGLIGELPPEILETKKTKPNTWKGVAPPAVPDLTSKSCEDVRKFTRQVIEMLNRLQKNFPDLDANGNLDTQLRLFGAKYLLSRVASNPMEREQLNQELLLRGEELLVQGSEHAATLRVVGQFKAQRGDFKAAHTLLRKAREKGDGSVELDRVLDGLARKPVFDDRRPRLGGGLVKLHPLIGASISAPSSPGPLTAALTIDGVKKAEARLVGTQLLFLPSSGDLTDGEHKMVLSAMDAAGNSAEEIFTLAVDKRAPTLKIAPEREVDGPRPVWTVILEDVGVGVDANSVNVEVRSVGDGATPLKEFPVTKGIYQKDLPAIGVKANDLLPALAANGTLTLKVSTSIDLTPGTYSLRILYSDRAGNPGKVEVKLFKVK